MPKVLASPTPVLPDVGISQSSLMAAALLAGFVVWLAMNGKLATYWSLLTGGSGATANATSSTTTGSTATGSTATGSGSTATTPSSGSGYLIPPMPSIGFPGVKGLF
jgi:hypothetical protein